MKIATDPNNENTIKNPIKLNFPTKSNSKSINLIISNLLSNPPNLSPAEMLK